MTRFALAAAVTLLLFAPSGASSAAGKEKKAAGNHIEGVVKTTKKPPAPAVIDRSSEPACAALRATFDDFVAGKSGELAGVHVRIKNGTAGKHTPPTWPVTVQQKDCTYLPHVAGIVAGQELAIINQDGFLHNVHAKIAGETFFNRSQSKGAPPIKQKDLGQAGEVLELGCDVHPWMKAFFPITDHPFFAVTEKDGRFSLKHVPPGQTFTIEAWHPVLGLQSVQARAGETVEIVFR